MRTRLLLLNYEWPPLGGGASPVSYEIAKQLSVTDEYNIDVVTMGFKGLPAYEELNANLRVHRVPCLRNKIEICHPWEQFTYLVTGYFKARSLIRARSYDICHTHFIIPTGVLAYVLQKQFGIPYVITSHGSDVLGYGKRFQLLYPLISYPWRAIVDRARTITSPSHFLKERIISAYGTKLNPEKIQVIPNGIDIEKFQPQPKKNYILSSGRLLPTKGFQHLIQAVSGENLGWEVHIAGDGPMMAELKKLAELSNTKIIFHGWMNNKSIEYKNLVEQAGIFVLASEKENASTALLEAMASGCAIITTKGTGTTEMVGADAALVDFADTDALRTELSKLAHNDELRRSSQSALQQRVHERYDWKSITEQYKKLI